MAEPKIGGMVFIQNPVEQRKQLGITHDDKVVERYEIAAHRDRLDSFHQMLRRNRAKRGKPPQD